MQRSESRQDLNVSLKLYFFYSLHVYKHVQDSKFFPGDAVFKELSQLSHLSDSCLLILPSTVAVSSNYETFSLTGYETFYLILFKHQLAFNFFQFIFGHIFAVTVKRGQGPLVGLRESSSGPLVGFVIY